MAARVKMGWIEAAPDVEPVAEAGA
jgi:hypothetical protein